MSISHPFIKRSAEFRDVWGASPKIFSLSENNLNGLTNRNARYMTELNYSSIAISFDKSISCLKTSYFPSVYIVLYSSNKQLYLQPEL